MENEEENTPEDNELGLFNKRFWRETAERVLKTGCQSVLLFLGVGQIAQSQAPSVNAWVFDWGHMSGVFVGGAIISLLTCIVSSPIGKKGDPSLL